jgi:hypothetical protein
MSQGGYMIIDMDMSSYLITDESATKCQYGDEIYCPGNQPTLEMSFQQQRPTIPTSLVTIDIDDFLVKMKAFAEV